MMKTHQNNFQTNHKDVVDNKDKINQDQGVQNKVENEINIQFNANSQFQKEINRLASFKNWSVPFIDKNFLALSGFYHIGPNDLVKCYFCKVEIGMWEPDDNVVDEHLKWSPNCRLICGRETENIPIDVDRFKRFLPQLSYDTCGIRDVRPSAVVESSSSTLANICSLNSSLALSNTESQPAEESLDQHPEFKIESHRFDSFLDWPKTMKQKPKDLAEAGFYYTGKGDRVICFSCGGGLKHWDESDDPWEQHAMWYGKCNYLNLVKGPDYIEKVLSKKNQNESKDEVNDQNNVAFTDENTNSSDTTSNNKLCKICFSRDYDTAFLPCGHIIACAKCASSVSKCPYCRQPFASVMRVYLS